MTEISESAPKPQLADMAEYFQTRLKTKGNEGGIIASADVFGNSVYTSTNKVERTLNDSVEARLVVSPKGKKLIVHNPGLLRMIADPPEDLEEIGEGSEGKVYRVALETPRGTRDFALKYTFGTNGIGETTFTPGVDQMQVLQLLQQEDPLPGLNYAVPVLASLDMTLTPYVPSALGSDKLVSLQIANSMFPDRIEQSIDNVIPKDEDRQMVKDIFVDARDGSDLFLKTFLDVYPTVNHGLYNWLTQHVPSANLALVTVPENMNFVEAAGPMNLVGSIAEMHNLFLRYKDDPTIIQEEKRAVFQRDVRKCFWLVEAMKGQKIY